MPTEGDTTWPELRLADAEKHLRSMGHHEVGAGEVHRDLVYLLQGAADGLDTDELRDLLDAVSAAQDPGAFLRSHRAAV